MNIHEPDPLILEALLKLRERGKPQYEGMGICCEVACYIGRAKEHGINWGPIYSRLSELFEDWPHHSGALEYPICSDPDYGKWEGPNAEARWDLVNYVINKLEGMLHEQQAAGTAD